MVDLHDAVAVYRDYNGKLRVDQSYQMTRWVVNIEAGFIRSKEQGLLASCPVFTTTSRRDVLGMEIIHGGEDGISFRFIRWMRWAGFGLLLGPTRQDGQKHLFPIGIYKNNLVYRLWIQTC